MFADIGSHIQDLMLWLGMDRPCKWQALRGVRQPHRSSVLWLTWTTACCSQWSSTTPCSGGEAIKFYYSNGRMTFYGDRDLLTADWAQMMTTEAAQIWIEQDGVRASGAGVQRPSIRRRPLSPL
jgi:hypothetical protein